MELMKNFLINPFLDLQFGPCLQNPLAYQGHSFTFEFGSI